jgi:hypothetical protein
MEWLRNFLKSREADGNRSKGMRSLNSFSDNKGIAELGHTTSRTTVLVQGVWYEVLYKQRGKMERA